jgi:hypothetical protein
MMDSIRKLFANMMYSASISSWFPKEFVIRTSMLAGKLQCQAAILPLVVPDLFEAFRGNGLGLIKLARARYAKKTAVRFAA